MQTNQYHDDPTIADNDSLLHRVILQPGVHIIWNHNESRWEPSSAAFKDHPDGSPMSVDILNILNSLGLPPDHTLKGYEITHCLVSFTAGVARGRNQKVIPQPLVDNQAHGIVIGKKTQGVRRALASASIWVVPPNLEPPLTNDALLRL